MNEELKQLLHAVDLLLANTPRPTPKMKSRDGVGHSLLTVFPSDIERLRQARMAVVEEKVDG